MGGKNGRKLIHLLFLVLILSVTAVPALPSALSADGPQGLQLAPLNPAFIDYLKKKQAALRSGTVAGQVSNYGYVPPSVDLSYIERLRSLAGKSIKDAPAGGSLPASFDWRTSGNVTPVKDQGACNTGWAFANIAVMESRVSISASHTSENYSEQSVVCCTDPSWSALAGDRCGNGGNDLMAQDTLIKKGARQASCQPYDNNTINEEPCSVCTPAYVTTNFVWVAMTDNDTPVRDAIKTAIQTYGPVTVSFFYDVANLITDNYTYYYEGSDPQNHTVSIVGWDDAEGVGSGAWLARNSLGTTWGNSGYFWLCYGKSNATDFGSLRAVKAYDSKEALYNWDQDGWVGNAGWSDSDTAWAANKYTTSVAGRITHVDFYTGGVGTQYNIFIYKGSDINSPGDPATTENGTCGGGPGYYSIPLAHPVALRSGQAFIVAVKMTTTGYYDPIAADGPTLVNSPVLLSGRSYLKHYDTGDPWVDLVSYDFCACLRARVYDTTITKPLAVTDNATGVSGTSATLNGTLSDDGWERCRYRFLRGTSPGVYTENTTWSTENITTGDTFNAEWSPLEPSKTYYFAASCNNTAGEGIGPEKSFKTRPLKPTGFGATVNSASQISLAWTKGTGATKTMVRVRSDGTSPNGPADGAEVYFGTDSAFPHTGLAADTTYLYGAWSWVDDGYGGDLGSDSHATASGATPHAPTVATDTATGITDTAATLNGTLTDWGGEPCQWRFLRGTSSGVYTENTTWSTDNKTNTQPFSANWTGRAPGMTYYYRAECKNSAGTGTGLEKSFTTVTAPTVTNTAGASSVMATTAILHGNLESDGGAPTTVTIYGGLTDGGTPSTPPGGWTLPGPVGVRPEGAFSLGVTGLSPNTTYYYRCYAINAVGPSWSSLNSFHTQTQLGIWRNYWAGPGRDWFWFSSGSP